MASLKQIENALDNIEFEGEKPEFTEAVTNLQKILAALNELTVKGRENVDVLLGCMICIEQIIGEEEDDG